MKEINLPDVCLNLSVGCSESKWDGFSFELDAPRSTCIRRAASAAASTVTAFRNAIAFH